MKRFVSALLAIVAVSSMLTACGQKGPLYLPDDENAGHSRDVFIR